MDIANFLRDRGTKVVWTDATLVILDSLDRRPTEVGVLGRARSSRSSSTMGRRERLHHLRLLVWRRGHRLQHPQRRHCSSHGPCRTRCQPEHRCQPEQRPRRKKLRPHAAWLRRVPGVRQLRHRFFWCFSGPFSSHPCATLHAARDLLYLVPMPVDADRCLQFDVVPDSRLQVPQHGRAARTGWCRRGLPVPFTRLHPASRGCEQGRGHGLHAHGSRSAGRHR